MTTNYEHYDKQEVADGCRGYIVIGAIIVTALTIFLYGVIKWATVY